MLRRHLFDTKPWFCHSQVISRQVQQRIRTHNWRLTINIKGLHEPTRESVEGFELTCLKRNILQDVCVGEEGGRGGLQSGDVYCWVAELAPSCNGHNINFTYSTVIRRKQQLFNVKWKFQWCLRDYAVISRNHPQLKAIQGGLNRGLAKLRYVPRRHQWKRPLTKNRSKFLKLLRNQID